MDNQSELRQLLLDCLLFAPTVNLRQNEGLRASMEQLLRECKGDNKYEAAAKALRADSGDHTPVASRAAKNTYLKNSNKSPNDVSMTKRTLSLSRSAYPPCRNAMPL